MPSTQQQGSDRIEGGPKVIDGYLTTGSSPGGVTRVHLLGLGSVGRALVHRWPRSNFRIVGLSDRSGTLVPRSHEDALAAADLKAAGAPLTDLPGALALPLPQALLQTDPDVVVDATHTDLGRHAWYEFLQWSVLEQARGLVLASKGALCRRGPAWVENFGLERIRFNAVLGGTGGSLADDLPVLHADVTECAIAGNASTTAIVEVVECGGSVSDGIAEAGRLGLLEPDPELDLQGVDAAIKLAIVVGLLTGKAVEPAAIVGPDVRDLSPSVLRRRRSCGSTTRLVGRYAVGGRPRLRFEELPLGHPLAVGRDEVRYRYSLRDGQVVEHEGGGLGADATADAVISDLALFSSSHELSGGVR